MRTSRVSRDASVALAARLKRARAATSTTAAAAAPAADSESTSRDDGAARRSSGRLAAFAFGGKDDAVAGNASAPNDKVDGAGEDDRKARTSTVSEARARKRQRREAVDTSPAKTPTKRTIKVQKLSLSPAALHAIKTELPSPPASSILDASASTAIKRDPEAPLPPPPTFNALPPLSANVPGPTKRWTQQYNLISEQRGTFVAPVDTMGCERLFDPKETPRVQRFQTLISLLLSSQTKDPVTSAAIKRLQTELDGGLTIDAVLRADESRIDELIRAVGFHNTKAKNMKRIAVILSEQHNYDVPDTLPQLLELPGIGPKMAHLTLQAAHGVTTGIGVDTHVHRLSNLLGWVKTKNPEETRIALEKFLPKDRWREINSLLVGFGQVVCGRVRRCGDCWLAREGACSKSTVRKDKWGQVKEEIQVGDVEDFGKIPVVVKEELES